jgi:uncharacterized Zn-binding protein involved in type VI secretion
MNAARVSDPTTHGAPLAPGIGSTNVFIGGMPAWRAMVDQHLCPAASVSGADGVGSVMKGSLTVHINGQMACRAQDIVVEKPGLALGPANPILMGCPTVTIGEKGPPAPPGFGSKALQDAQIKAAQEPIPERTPQGAAIMEAAQEGLPLIEKCPYVKHA